jgi:hypothetical protein
MFVPLAHGALGIWDEVIPILLVGGFAAILIVTGLLSRRNESKLEEHAENPPPAEQIDAQPDHYRLD